MSSIAGIIAPTLFTRLFAAVTKSHLHAGWAGATFWLAAVMVGAGLVLAWYTSAHLPASVTVAPPQADITSEILASTADIQPSAAEGESRAANQPPYLTEQP